MTIANTIYEKCFGEDVSATFWKNQFENRVKIVGMFVLKL